MGDKRDWVGVELEDIVPGGGTGYLQVRLEKERRKILCMHKVWCS